MTTAFITDSDDNFPDDDYFPDINNLFDDMGDNGANINANANGAAPVPAPYVIFLHLFEIMLQTLLIAICLDMLFAHYPLDCMTSLISLLLVMFYLLFLWIKSCDILLIFPTIQKPYYRQFTPSSFVASMKPPMFESMHYKRWHVRAVLWF